jgi:S-adenosylmethionine-diacylglycerol 3-amino-3-carboxypropyl transferase
MPSAQDLHGQADRTPMTTAPSTLERLHQGVFDRLYSSSLLYNACWEDPACDRQALRLGGTDEVLVITSAGCNALDYLLCGPRRVTAVDANPRQNALLELKVATIRSCADDEVFAMFGAGRHPGARELYGDRLRAQLSPAAQAFWDRRINWFVGRGGDSFYFHGLSGLVARLMRAYLRTRPGLRPAIVRLLACNDLAEQVEVYDREVAPRLWTPFLSWAISRQTTMSLIGVPPAQTREVAAQHDGAAPAAHSVAGFIRACIERVFRLLPLSTNYFWTCYMRGGYTRDNCPEYLRPANLAALRGGLLDRLEIRTDTVAGLLASDERPFSRFVLLDHQDWMGAHRPHDLGKEWDLLLQRARPDALTIFRSARAEPPWLPAVRLADGTRLGERLRFDRTLASRLHEQDRVGTYGGFHVAHV